jgi:hypothetical protein
LSSWSVCFLQFSILLISVSFSIVLLLSNFLSIRPSFYVSLFFIRLP